MRAAIQLYHASTRARRLRSAVSALTFVLLFGLAAEIAQLRPAILIGNFPAFFSYFQRTFILDGGQFAPLHPGIWFWGLKRWLRLLFETITMAYLATLMGASGAFVMSFAASRNLSPPILRQSIRRFLEFCRTVPDIVFAMIFVAAFGLGPLPGILAIAIHSCGALGKQFFEQIEAVDGTAVQSLRATGAPWPAVWRFAVLPQVAAKFSAYAALRFEINIRQATVLGLVGAGGIGQDLLSAIRMFYYSDVSAILLLIVVTVAIFEGLISIVTRRLMAPTAAS